MALSIYTAEELSKLSFLEETNILKKEVDTYKPLPKETEDRILQKFRLDWNYHSNAIEGNKLTYGETVAFLMEGITAKAKPLKDHLDIKGHDETVKFLLSLVKDKDYLLTEADIRNLHLMLLKEPYWTDAVTPDGLSDTKKEIKIGQYKSTPNHVKTPTGEIHYYATPEQTPILMGELMEWYRKAKLNTEIHPLILAVLFHHEFTSIHPFDDGNGRMARLLMNLMLMQVGYPPIVVKQDDRLNYYQVLRQADAGEYIPIADYMNNLIHHSLNIYLKGAKGENIEELDDIKKEISLFKLSQNDKTREKRSGSNIQKIFLNSIIPLAKALIDDSVELRDMFFSSSTSLLVKQKKDSLAYNLISLENIPALIETNKNINARDIYKLMIRLECKGFKKANDPFDYKLGLSFDFLEYFYLLSEPYVLDKLYKKKYDDFLVKEEIQEIVKAFLKKCLKDLKARISNE